MQRIELRAGTRALVLGARDIARHLDVPHCIAAVEEGFRQLGLGAAQPPVTAGVRVPGGVFHIKAGVLGRYCAVKTNGNFPSNASEWGLPTVQGVVLLCDAAKGGVLAILDSGEITARRTAAATAVAARYLAPRDARVLALVGCGVQAGYQLAALREVLPIRRLVAVDRDRERAIEFARSVRGGDLESRAGTVEDAARLRPDVWVTCTTSYAFLLQPEHVREGAFVAGVGVDDEHKRELAPALLARAHVVVDHLEQCARMGDLHHAIEANVAPRSLRELGSMVAERESGRLDPDGIHIFDSTGIAIQDVVACAAVFEAALKAEADGPRSSGVMPT